MSEENRVWLAPPHGVGEPKEVEATPAILVPLMVSGWHQCAPPAAAGNSEEVSEHGNS